MIMKKVAFCFILTLLIPRFLAADDLESPYKIAGSWVGVLSVNGVEMPLVFEFKELGGKRLSGVMRSPQQSQMEIPLNFVSLKNRDLEIAVTSVGGSYSGKLSPKSRKFRGKWTQGNYSLPLELSFSEKGFEMNRPQTPGDKPPYAVEEVRFPNKTGNIVLDGTLTLPRGSMQGSPVAILVSGSGSQDRDETLFGHKPFLLIADYLTRKGIAVLRYDDRGVGGSTGTFKFATHMDFADDAAAAVAYLKSRKEIDRKKIGIIGHSEGGMIAPIVATRHPGDVAFIVMLAGPGVRGDQTILTQTRALGMASGLPESFIELNQQFSKALFRLLLADNPDLTKIEELGKKFEAEAKKLKDVDPDILVSIGESIQQQLKGLDQPWLPNFIQYDPGPTLENVRCPVLALNGEKDLQVPPGIHLPEIRKRLKTAGNPKSRVEELRGLNHLFQKAKTGLPTEYSKIEETISPSVLRMMADWIHEVVR